MKIEFNNIRELITFLHDTAHDIDIDDEDLAKDLRILADYLKEAE